MTSKRVFGLVGLAILVGIGVGWIAKPSARAVQLHARERLPVINAHLADAPAGFVFLAGDSHAELASPAVRLCGREVVNGGISGARSGLYADIADGFRFVAQPAAVILTIGTNDLLRKDDPRSPDQIERFETAITRIVQQFKRHTEQVVVTAVPPVGRASGDKIEGAVPAFYSERLEALCSHLGCRFVDPFAASRGEGGFGRPEEMPDSLHFASYRAPLSRLEQVVCPGFHTR